MTDHTPSPGTSQPGTLVLRTAGTCHLDMPHLVDVLGALPASTRTALSHLAEFFNTPAEQRSA